MKAAFRMSGKLSLDEKNETCPPSIRFGDHGRVFDYTRRNIGKKSVTYYCTHARKCDCKAKLVLPRDKRTGIVDHATKTIDGQHARACCVINQVKPDDYNWEGKQTIEEEEEENDDPNPSTSKARKIASAAAAVDTRINGSMIIVNKSKFSCTIE